MASIKTVRGPSKPARTTLLIIFALLAACPMLSDRMDMMKVIHGFVDTHFSAWTAALPVSLVIISVFSLPFLSREKWAFYVLVGVGVFSNLFAVESWDKIPSPLKGVLLPIVGIGAVFLWFSADLRQRRTLKRHYGMSQIEDFLIRGSLIAAAIALGFIYEIRAQLSSSLRYVAFGIAGGAALLLGAMYSRHLFRRRR